jgi:hypothetical protein
MVHQRLIAPPNATWQTSPDFGVSRGRRRVRATLSVRSARVLSLRGSAWLKVRGTDPKGANHRLPPYPEEYPEVLLASHEDLVNFYV